MMPMFSRQIEPRLAMRKYPPPYDAPLTILSRVIKVAGLGESTVQERLGDLVFSTQPEVGIYHKFGTVELKLTSSAPSLDECKRINVEVERQMVALLGDAVYGFDDDSLASSVATLLARRGATVAVHEVGSEGQLAAALARARPAGASAKSVLAAGTVAADPEGARLDPAAVAAAARAAQQRAKAHYGVAVSGVSQDGEWLLKSPSRARGQSTHRRFPVTLQVPRSLPLRTPPSPARPASFATSTSTARAPTRNEPPTWRSPRCAVSCFRARRWRWPARLRPRREAIAARGSAGASGQ
jgi:hypothetical protein